MRAMQILIAVAVLLMSVWLHGCAAPWTKKEPERPFEKQEEAIKRLLESDDRPKVIGEIASKIDAMLAPIAYEYFGFVTGLMNTGGDTKPSPQREIMLDEMRTEGVTNPAQLMMSKETAVVKVRAVALPGARRGDLIDAIVEISDMSEATSIENGTLLRSRLREVALLKGMAREGFEKAHAQGPIVTLPLAFTNKDELNVRQGLILGGARILDTRHLGIRMRDTFAHPAASGQVGKAINERFFLYDGSTRRGVAIPKDDDYIQIDLAPKYRYDCDHYMNVILNIPFLEPAFDRKQRIERCQKLLHEPTTSKTAAWQLEAIGVEAKEALKAGLNNPDPQIRFNAAYSLAYLDDDDAVPVLMGLIEEMPELRARALLALTILEPLAATEALEMLLQNPAPDVRYGAFHALYRKNPRDSNVMGEVLGDSVRGHVARIVQVPSATQLVVVSLRDRPEIVCYGPVPIINLQTMVELNPRLLIRPDTQGNIRVVRLENSESNDVHSDNIAMTTPPDLWNVLRAIYRVGGSYNDMVRLMDTVVRHQWMDAMIAFDPRPGSERLQERLAGMNGSIHVPVYDPILDEVHVNNSITDRPQYGWWNPRRYFATKK